jgi:hypothetical protein
MPKDTPYKSGKGKNKGKKGYTAKYPSNLPIGGSVPFFPYLDEEPARILNSKSNLRVCIDTSVGGGTDVMAEMLRYALRVSSKSYIFPCSEICEALWYRIQLIERLETWNLRHLRTLRLGHPAPQLPLGLGHTGNRPGLPPAHSVLLPPLGRMHEPRPSGRGGVGRFQVFEDPLSILRVSPLHSTARQYHRNLPCPRSQDRVLPREMDLPLLRRAPRVPVPGPYPNRSARQTAIPPSEPVVNGRGEPSG